MAITEATLLEYLFSEGQEVKEGDALYVIETEKVETEVSSDERRHPLGFGEWVRPTRSARQIAFIEYPGLINVRHFGGGVPCVLVPPRPISRRVGRNV